jgi:hypothetical protein
MKHSVMPLAIVAAAAGLAGLMATAHAQPVDAARNTPESVTVSGQKMPEYVIKEFVKSHAGAAPALGKMAKWVRPICPVTTGLTPAMNRLVNDRVRAVAAMVEAPVAEKSPCAANIDIVFTQKPQILLDRVRKEHPALLGYHQLSQTEDAAKVRYPIQAWYTTETVDFNRAHQVDDPQANNGVDLYLGPNPACLKGCILRMPYARKMQVSGGRITDSLRSEFYHVMVVIDLDKIGGLELGALADDAASLALAQPQAFDACLSPASITNLMTPGCADKPKTLTTMDLAFLRAVYRLDTAKVFASQRSEIAYQMTKALGAGN